MLHLFYAGGPLFMSILSLLFGAVLWAKFRFPSALKTLANLAIACGFFAFMLGLYQLFQAVEIEQVNISPALLAGGLKNAIIAPLYGSLIYVISYFMSLFPSN